MQELVDHCARQNHPEIVEAAVMHLDIASLDLNQVIEFKLRLHFLKPIYVNKPSCDSHQISIQLLCLSSS